MTTGSNVISRYAGTSSVYFDGAYQSQSAYGRYSSRTWTGGDSPKVDKPSRPYIRRKYTTIDPKTRKIKTRYFKVYQTDKPNRHKDPHAYDATYRVFENGANYQMLEGITGYWSRYRSGGFGSGPEWLSAPKWRPSAPSFTAENQYKLIDKLRTQIRGSKFNMAVTLGESREALQMIGDSATRLVSGYRYARKGNFVAAIQAMSRSASHARKNYDLLPKRLKNYDVRRMANDQLSSNWLELQYGWLPLLSDIRSGAEFVAHQLNVPRRQRYVARLRVQNPNPKAGRSYVGADDYAFASRQIIAYVSEQPESIPKLSGLLDPEVVAWELTPFSFVVDWFLPIGDYLNARAFAALSGQFITTDKIVENMSGVLQGNSFDYSPGHVQYATMIETDVFVDRSVRIIRTISSSLDVPYPAVKPLSEALSWKHAVNAIALVAAVFKGPLTWASSKR